MPNSLLTLSLRICKRNHFGEVRDTFFAPAGGAIVIAQSHSGYISMARIAILSGGTLSPLASKYRSPLLNDLDSARRISASAISRTSMKVQGRSPGGEQVCPG